MTASELAAWPAEPPSEVEWEDLLYRLELMTRALRVTLEDDLAAEPVRDPLRDAIHREVEVFAWLAEHALERVPGAEERAALASDAARSDDPRELAERLIGLRRRNFAMVQRRGIDVWAWRGSTRAAEGVSLYQLLGALAKRDATLLATLREARSAEGEAC